MTTPRHLALVSLAVASLALSACARPGVQAVPAVPWETPAAAPSEQPAPATAPATPEPTAAPTPEGTQPTPVPQPEAAPPSAPAPAPAETASSAPSPKPSSTLPAAPKAAAAPAAKPTTPAKPAAGPALMAKGANGDNVRDVQARLAQLGWFSGRVTGYYGDATVSAVSGFQAKRGLTATGAVDRGTLTTLQSMTKTPTRADLGLEAPAAPSGPAAQSANGLDSRCLTGRVLCISKNTNKLYWVVNGEIKQTLSVRFGTSKTPTREGTFQVDSKSRNHVSTLYDTAMPYAMFFSRGQAVHYSADFATNGYSGGSHGCVNVRDKAGIQWLFGQVSVGDKVVVYS